MHGHIGTPRRASVKAGKGAKRYGATEPGKVKASDGTVYDIQPSGAFRVCDSCGRPATRLTNQQKKAYKRGRVKALKALKEKNDGT